jgi:hypothetical protein
MNTAVTASDELNQEVLYDEVAQVPQEKPEITVEAFIEASRKLEVMKSRMVQATLTRRDDEQRKHEAIRDAEQTRHDYAMQEIVQQLIALGYHEDPVVPVAPDAAPPSWKSPAAKPVKSVNLPKNISKHVKRASDLPRQRSRAAKTQPRVGGRFASRA